MLSFATPDSVLVGETAYYIDPIDMQLIAQPVDGPDGAEFDLPIE